MYIFIQEHFLAWKTGRKSDFYKIVTNQSPTSKNIWDLRCWAWWCTGQCPCHLHLKHTEMCLEINLP